MQLTTHKQLRKIIRITGMQVEVYSPVLDFYVNTSKKTILEALTNEGTFEAGQVEWDQVSTITIG